jgi:hypothetical protein
VNQFERENAPSGAPDQQTLTLTIQLPQPATVVVLQRGNWSPIGPLCASTILLDRNVIATLDCITRGGTQPSVSDRFWLDKLNEPSYRLTPLVAAFEGNQRTAPSFDAFQAEYHKGLGVITRALPGAQAAAFGEEELRGLFALHESRRPRYLAECQFFRAIAPLLVHRVARSRLSQVEAQLLDRAVACGVPLRAFAVVAALSCLYESDAADAMPVGRGIIKPTQTYSVEDAHNAASDIASLEFLARLVYTFDRDFGLHERQVLDRTLVRHATQGWRTRRERESFVPRRASDRVVSAARWGTGSRPDWPSSGMTAFGRRIRTHERRLGVDHAPPDCDDDRPLGEPKRPLTARMSGLRPSAANRTRQLTGRGRPKGDAGFRRR